MQQKVIKFNDKAIKVANSDGILKPFSYTLPPMTLRFRFVKSDVDPSGLTTKGTWSKVQNVEENLWDWTYDDPDWSDAFWAVFSKENGFSEQNYVELIDAGDTSKVTNLSRFLDGYDSSGKNNATYLKNICLFNTQNVTNMYRCFDNCRILETVPLFDTSNLESMQSTFMVCQNLESVHLFDTSNVTTMRSTFARCSKLKTIPQYNTSNVTSFYNIFNLCPSLESIPTLDYGKTTDIGYFIGANAETGWALNMEALPDMSTLTTALNNCAHAFKNARNVKYNILDTYNTLVSCNPSAYTDCFLNCGINTEEGRAQLEQIPSGWGGLAT